MSANSILVACFTALILGASAKEYWWAGDNNWANSDNWVQGRIPEAWAKVEIPPSFGEFNGGKGANMLIDQDFKLSQLDFPDSGDVDLANGVTLDLASPDGLVVDLQWRSKGEEEQAFRCAKNWVDKDGNKASRPPCYNDVAIFPQGRAYQVNVPVHTYVDEIWVGGAQFTSANEGLFKSAADEMQYAGETVNLDHQGCKVGLDVPATEPCARYCINTCFEESELTELELTLQKLKIAEEEKSFLAAITGSFDVATDTSASQKQDLKALPLEAEQPVQDGFVPSARPGAGFCATAQDETACTTASNVQAALTAQADTLGNVAYKYAVWDVEGNRRRRDSEADLSSLNQAATSAEYLEALQKTPQKRAEMEASIVAAVTAQLPDYMSFYPLEMSTDGVVASIDTNTGGINVTITPLMKSQDHFMRLYTSSLIADAASTAVACITSGALAVSGAKFYREMCPDAASIQQQYQEYGASVSDLRYVELELDPMQLLVPLQQGAGVDWISSPHFSLNQYKAKKIAADKNRFEADLQKNLRDYFIASVVAAEYTHNGPLFPNLAADEDAASASLAVTLLVPNAVWENAPLMFESSSVNKWTNAAASRAAVVSLEVSINQEVEQLQAARQRLQGGEEEQPTTAAPDPKEMAKPLPWAIIGGAAGGGLLVIVILAAVVLRRRSSSVRTERANRATTELAKKMSSEQVVVSFQSAMFDGPTPNAFGHGGPGFEEGGPYHSKPTIHNPLYEGDHNLQPSNGAKRRESYLEVAETTLAAQVVQASPRGTQKLSSANSAHRSSWTDDRASRLTTPWSQQQPDTRRSWSQQDEPEQEVDYMFFGDTALREPKRDREPRRSKRSVRWKSQEEEEEEEDAARRGSMYISVGE